jgi:hypothetical protein
MHFSPYSNLNDKSIVTPRPEPSSPSINRSQYKIYKIRKSSTNSTANQHITCHEIEMKSLGVSNNNDSSSSTTEKLNTSDTSNSDIYSGSFVSDSQFMQYQPSYNNLFNYQQKANLNLKRSDSLISLSSQVDLATIESNLKNNETITETKANPYPQVQQRPLTPSKPIVMNHPHILLTHKKSKSVQYTSNTSLNMLRNTTSTNSDTEKLYNSAILSHHDHDDMHCHEATLLPDVYSYSKKNASSASTSNNTSSKTKIKTFFSEKVFNTGSSIKYKVKSSSSSSINLIEEFQQTKPANSSSFHKHNVKALSAKGTDLLVNNFNRISSKIV